MMVRVGKVARPHGVRGAVAITLDNPASESLFGVDHVHLGPEPRRLEVRRTARGKSGQVILELEGIDSVESAETLRGLEVLLEEEQLPPLGPDEYWHRDLLGLEAVLENGSSLGRVREIVDTADVPVLVIGRGKEERYVPFHRSFVLEVELGQGRVVVQPPEELG